jgi:hypothetical protein
VPPPAPLPMMIRSNDWVTAADTYWPTATSRPCSTLA